MSEDTDSRTRRIELCAKVTAYLTYTIAVIYISRAIADDISHLWNPESGNSAHAIIVILGLIGGWLFHRRLLKI